MATAFNTTVKLYAGVPLVKGGTEVLYLSAGAAEAVLSAYLSATYTAYYFERENRRYIQIDDVFGSMDSVNYISFANNSHGGKIYFGFVDQVVYVNDHNTQIEFTLDPFPTFLGDTTMLDDVYVVRNTLAPGADIPRANLQPDYMPDSARENYVLLDSFEVSCRNNVQVVFAGKAGTGVGILSPAGYYTGIQHSALSDAILTSIKNDGGNIIGAFLYPDDVGSYDAVELAQSVGVLTGNPLAHMSAYSFEKMKSGVYTKVALATTNNFKLYELEDFSNPNSVSFGIVRFFAPAFAIFIYPKNYRGVPENTSEGLYMQAPALSISAQQGYSNAQLSSDIFSGVMAGITGAVAGAAKGGAPGAVVGGLAGLAGGGINIAKNAYMAKFNPREVTGSSVPITSDSFKLSAALLAVSPSLTDCTRISRYLEYYGYNLEEVKPSSGVNLLDGAYLQTGSEFVHGSEADAQLNARIMSGIKIRRTL